MVGETHTYIHICIFYAIHMVIQCLRNSTYFENNINIRINMKNIVFTYQYLNSLSYFDGCYSLYKVWSKHDKH